MVVIPDKVVAFLRDHIDSLEQLEVLLLLRNQPDKQWTPVEVSRTLSSNPASVVERLAQFAAKGFLATSEVKGTYQYCVQPELDQVIGEVADAYALYPVRIIGLIFSKPIDKIRTFADAFKLRKEDK
jgi:hypothetical protein